MEKKNKLLIIFAVCFIIVFAVIIICVNNWLKQTLKEETASGKQAAVVYSEKSKYVQKPIEIIPGQQAASLAQKKKTIPGSSLEAVNKEVFSVSPPEEKILIN